MRRLVVPILALAAASTCASALATPGAGITKAKKKAFVRLQECSLEQRSARFYARMRTVRDTAWMKLRFTLLERSGGRFHRVDAPELAQWRKSDPGVKVFGYHQEVRGLDEGSAYRVIVRYRWYDAGGEVIKRQRRRSRICRQFEELPNLRVRALGKSATATSGVWRYEFRVRNVGSATAHDVPVALSVDGAVIDTLSIARLRPGDARTLRFRGPGCATGYAANVDPDAAIAETDESDNHAGADC